MFINRIAHQLLAVPEFESFMSAYRAGDDATLAVSRSARSLVLAALWSCDPRPCLYVVSGEEAADCVSRALVAWLGADMVCQYPERTDLPWSDAPPDYALVGARCHAIEQLAKGMPRIVVASARSLLRCVPPAKSDYYASSTFSLCDHFAYEELGSRFVHMGYRNTDTCREPGTFHIHGDVVDIFPAHMTNPVRIEFFGDEIDRIRRVVRSTGQAISELESITITPCCEVALTPKTRAHAAKALYGKARLSSEIASDLECIEAGMYMPELDRYLPAFYGGSSSPLEHLSSQTLVTLDEPRSLFDDCQRAFDELTIAAKDARQKTKGLYCLPRDMDFGSQQRISFSTIMQENAHATAKLAVHQPGIAGSDKKLLERIRGLLASKTAVIFAIPDSSVRSHMKLAFSDESIPFVESLASAPENAVPLVDKQATKKTPELERGVVTFFDAPVPAGTVIPSAHLAVFSAADFMTRRSRYRKHRRVELTSVTFPFKPGDYVVHATHGIALFADIVRSDAGGHERDYFLLKYAGGDKLFVPLEQVDRITRFVGADATTPRLTRLNTADWSRAYAKARKNAKKLAFDLIDLYTRRSSVTGRAFAPDTSEQAEMEERFPYELTRDQARALADIKTDMETAKPMDRLLCGDVGFGKTEVAMRAAFKCVADGSQVMVLCPTTILAQQHFETFFERFMPLNKRVDVLSRLRTSAQQHRTLKAFAEGEVDVLIGTHRLLSPDVNPSALGLVIVDEEQRFGVQHKEQLKNMREYVDVLTLSATPIPRTMQMALSGVRDMSLIMTPPPGRLPVIVRVGEYNPDVVSDAIRSEMARHGQVYYVSNRVTTIDDAVERVAEAAPEARIGVVHGKMSPTHIEDVMLAFTEREIDVLIATTIIESGIDNPHTNTLIIEDSQRLGLAQLYQLKGKVGRGRVQAFAYFMFPGKSPLTPEATDRLLAIDEFQELGSGMRIAMRDLEIRGAGSIMGSEQHGNLSSVGFDLYTQMLSEAVAEARGEVPNVEHSDVVINIPAEFFLADEYIAAIDQRVLIYRRIAGASDLSELDDIEHEVEEEHGAMPEAARNLFVRTRLRMYAQQLGITSVVFTQGRLICKGMQISSKITQTLKANGACVYPKTGKVVYAVQATDNKLERALYIMKVLGDEQ